MYIEADHEKLEDHEEFGWRIEYVNPNGGTCLRSAIEGLMSIVAFFVALRAAFAPFVVIRFPQ